MKIVKTASGKSKIKMSRREWWDIGRQAKWMKHADVDYVEIGSTPPDEDCAQVGEEDYSVKSRQECRRYIDLIRQKLGPEPSGARLVIKSNPHDFGTYYEVVCKYDDNYPEAVDYAFMCESDGPQTWTDVSPVNTTIEPPENLGGEETDVLGG